MTGAAVSAAPVIFHTFKSKTTAECPPQAHSSASDDAISYSRWPFSCADRLFR